MELIIFIRVFLGTILLAAAIPKLISLKSFRTTLVQLGIKKLSFSISIVIVFSEIIVGILLYIDKIQKIGGVMVIVLSFGYLWAAWRSKRINNEIACNCFGNLIPETLGYHTVGKVVFLLLLDYSPLIYNSTLFDYSFYKIVIYIFVSLISIGLYGLILTINNLKNSWEGGL